VIIIVVTLFVAAGFGYLAWKENKRADNAEHELAQSKLVESDRLARALDVQRKK
jgi:flagellar basal body-associated protein FliL